MKQLLLVFLLILSGSSFAYHPGTPVPPDTLSCDTLWLKSGKIMLVTLISDNGKEIKFSDCPPNEIVSTIPKSSTKLSPRDSIIAAQRATMCDTIYVKGGEIVTGHMVYYNSRKVVYTGCCTECTTQKILKRKDVDSIIYVDGRKIGTDVPNEVDPNNPNNSNSESSTTEKPQETVYSPEEVEDAKKKSKLYGILGLVSIGIILTGALLVILSTGANPLVFGLLFFVGVIAGLAFAMGYVRNRKKAGLKKEKKRNKKKD